MSTNISTSSKIAERIREERERLCISQALLASMAGVSRMSQVNYESGKRSPDANYLRAIAESGVDVGFVVTGKRSGAPDFFRLATTYVLESIDKRTGFAEDVLTFVIEYLAGAATSSWLDTTQNKPPDFAYNMAEFVDIYSVDALIAALFENARLLRDIFGAINSALKNNPKQISGEKKLSLVLMLFKTFKGVGEIDLDVIQDAVDLAS